MVVVESRWRKKYALNLFDFFQPNETLFYFPEKHEHPRNEVNPNTFDRLQTNDTEFNSAL